MVVFAHPHFLDTFESLIEQVERLRAKDPKDYTAKDATKLGGHRQARLRVNSARSLAPGAPSGYNARQRVQAWFRAKFFQQYWHFFRYHLESRIIIYAGVNDEDTKRAYESNTDAYRSFRRMPKSGKPAG